MRKLVVTVLMATLIGSSLVGCGAGSEAKKEESVAEKPAAEVVEESDGKPAEEATEKTGVNPKIAIDVENYGIITVELDEKAAPVTVENFIKLAKDGFYDGLTFHRIMDGFMMQGGDPTGTGMGGADKTIKGEFSNNGVDNKLSHTKGAISMARSQDPDSASSQFFIVDEDSDFLDGDYAAFGYVTEGQDIVDAICAEATVVDGNGTVEPDNQPIIKAIKVI